MDWEPLELIQKTDSDHGLCQTVTSLLMTMKFYEFSFLTDPIKITINNVYATPTVPQMEKKKKIIRLMCRRF